MINLPISRRFGSQVLIAVSPPPSHPPSPSLSHHLTRKSPDVGGGSVPNDTRHSLARIPLRWMLRQLFILNTGLLFHKNMFTSIGIDPNTLHPHVLPRPAPLTYTPSCPAHRFMPPLNFARDEKRTVPGGTGTETGDGDGGEGEGEEGGEVGKVKEAFVSEEMEDLLDSLTPIYDQLRMVKGWWVLEVLPYKHRYQKMDNQWTQSKGYVIIIIIYPTINFCSDSPPFFFCLVGLTWAFRASYPNKKRWALKSTGPSRFAWKLRGCSRIKVRR
jgi:hypothetical protein